MLEAIFATALLAPSPDCGIVECGGRGGGVYVGLVLEEVVALADAWPEGASAESPTSWYEYSAVISCDPNTPDNPRQEICQSSIEFCEEFAPESPGPHAHIWRRVVDQDGTIGNWGQLAYTCYSPNVPSRSGEPAQELTEAMIVEQFHRTQFALPEMSIQPPDGRTLVHLPVYFELVWPDDGFQPEEIDTTTIVGHEVRIRPLLIGATYNTGDGTVIGPTLSLGGPHPDGDITHEYTNAAEVNPSITVEYGGEVSVNGGGWTRIPSSAVIEGPSTPLQVLTSRNRLYGS